MVRGKGEGSIYQRSDGRWVAQIEAGRSPAGRRRYARGVRRTRKDAQKALKEVQRAAVLLLDQGVPLEVVSAVLGSRQPVDHQRRLRPRHHRRQNGGLSPSSTAK
jgi:hypothetical protein